jgi:hypothetical protein
MTMNFRIKEYELEKARNRARLQALKEKIAELEGTINTLREENDQLQKQLDKQDALKIALTRKDQVLQQVRNQYEKAKQDYENLTAYANQQQQEAEKRIK